MLHVTCYMLNVALLLHAFSFQHAYRMLRPSNMTIKATNKSIYFLLLSDLSLKRIPCYVKNTYQKNIEEDG